MMKQKFLNKYKQTSIETGMENSTPHKLIAMLYDGILDNLAHVKGAIQRKDFELKANKLNKALLIIGSLRSNLDMENAKEVSDNYDTIYRYINRKLLEASAKNDVKILDEAAILVKELRSGWLLIPENLKKASKSQIDNLKEN